MWCRSDCAQRPGVKRFIVVVVDCCDVETAFIRGTLVVSVFVANNELNIGVSGCSRIVEKAKETLGQGSRHDSQKQTEKPAASFLDMPCLAR